MARVRRFERKNPPTFCQLQLACMQNCRLRVRTHVIIVSRAGHCERHRTIGTGLGNLVCLKTAGRRIQMLEEAQLLSPVAPPYEGAAHFMCNLQQQGAVVAPALSRFVATRLQVEAQVAKEQRTGHEERTLARKGKPGKPNPAEKQ